MKRNNREGEPKPVEGVAEPKKKAKWWKIVLVSFAGLVLLLTLTIAIWWTIAGVKSFSDGLKLMGIGENNLYFKSSYSVDDKKAVKKSDQVIATIGDHKLTNGVLQVYYWLSVYDFLENYPYYAVYNGMDYTKPLDEQNHPENEGTWQHFFLEEALRGWQAYQAMAILAEKEGIGLSEDMQKSLDNLRSTLATSAVQGGYASIDAMLQAEMGAGVTFEDYYQYTKTYYEGYMYYSAMYDKIDTSPAALEAYFAANEEALKQQGITKDSGNNYDVRHILIEIQGGTKGEDGKMTYSDEEWEKCREKAQKLLDEWLAGEYSEDTFAALAKEHSVDGGSKENGGLYTKLDKNTSFVKEFVAWYMEKDRKVGDYGLIKTDYGYHIMYCSKIEAKWEAACLKEVLADVYEDILQAAVDEYPMEVNYKKIALGVVDLGK